MRSKSTLLAATLLAAGIGDAMLCGVIGPTSQHIATVRDVIGMRHGARTLAVMQMLILDQHQLFICDTHVNPNPTADGDVPLSVEILEAVVAH
jgi:malate dehydrogenase (oxaloacetate-decarboxylating)(NADP+)